MLWAMKRPASASKVGKASPEAKALAAEMLESEEAAAEKLSDVTPQN